MNPKTVVKLIGGGIATIIVLIIFFKTLQFATIQGNQIGVKETWSGGIDMTPMTPGTHILFPGWTQRVYPYDLSTEVFVMNDNKGDASGKGAYKGRDADAYHVQSSEGQDMAISLVVQWRLDPAKIIEIHKTVRTDVEEKVIRPIVMRVVKDEATTRKAIDAYSGEGLVKLQKDIEADLTNPNGELAQRGVIVDSFVIEGIKLDENYIGEIRARQVASQKKLRADEETKAAEAEALKAKADAQADFNKRVVEAERDAKVAITKSKQEAESQVLNAKAASDKVLIAAEADQKKVVLEAEGEKQAGVLRAQGIEAIGKAKASAIKLEMEAYSADSTGNYTKMKVAESLASGFSNIRGYLPVNMSVNVLSENFLRSVETILTPQAKK